MTDVERLVRPSTPRPVRGLRHSRWVFPILAVVAVCFCTVTISSRPADAQSLKSARAEAAVLYAQIRAADARISLLGQKYDEAQYKLGNLEALITHSRDIVAAATRQVKSDEDQLREAAINYYVNNGAANSQNPLFASSESEAQLGATNVYSSLAEGNLDDSVASLKLSSIQLTQQRYVLRGEIALAARQSRAASKALHEARAIQQNLSHTLAGVSSEIHQYLVAAEEAAAAKAAAQWNKTHKVKHHKGKKYKNYYDGYPPPPANSRANVAVRAAYSYLGVPYVWGGASRSGVDCSGLVMLSWDAAGVSLPHYSGAQFADTVRVPLWDLRPGDLLFYGYNGDEHVTMYIGHGEMIEAPETGYTVHITPVRLGYGFAGAGRPRL